MGSKRLIKSYAPHLAPFWKATAYYFLLYFSVIDCETGWYYAILKLLPMMALITFTVLHGASLHGNDIHGSSYSRFILWGLSFSAIGDVLIVWKQSYFILAIIAFAIAHIMYTMAFGFDRLCFMVGVVLGLSAIVFWKLVTIRIQGIMVKAVFVYACIISMMLWRAIARVEPNSDLKASGAKRCSCVGAIFFTISDICIAISQFLTPIKWSNQIIMLTYYLAQLGIAVSVVEFQSKRRGMHLKRLMLPSTTVFRKHDRHHNHRRSRFSGEKVALKDGERSPQTRTKSESALSERANRKLNVAFADERGSESTEANSEIKAASQFSIDQTLGKGSDLSLSIETFNSEDSTLQDSKTMPSRKSSSTTICTSYSGKRKNCSASKEK